MHLQLKNVTGSIVSASGGARMQESILSLMQMAKTTAALAKLHENGHPLSFGFDKPHFGRCHSLFCDIGDVIIAEPDALIGICWASSRRAEIRQKLPPAPKN